MLLEIEIIQLKTVASGIGCSTLVIVVLIDKFAVVTNPVMQGAITFETVNVIIKKIALLIPGP